MKITALDPSRTIVREDFRMAQIFWLWTNDVQRLSQFTGEGSPEGVVSAEQGREYMDILGTSGSIKYIKRDSEIGGNDKLGWILI